MEIHMDKRAKSRVPQILGTFSCILKKNGSTTLFIEFILCYNVANLMSKDYNLIT